MPANQLSGAEARIGIIANPHAARDVRRLVTGASSIPVSERAAICHRVFTGLAELGVGQVLLMRDRGGIADKLVLAIERRALTRPNALPQIKFLDMPVSGRPDDTLHAVRLMVESGVGAIVVLGGDGTHRLVAHECGQIPLVCISTGTNNAFPGSPEATIAGLAAGAVGRHLIQAEKVCRTNKRLTVHVNGKTTVPALVDVCITSEQQTGARALWRPERFRHLYLAYAEPGQVGLSSIGSLLCPVSRCDDAGLAIDIDAAVNASHQLMAPIAPGLFEPVSVTGFCKIHLNERCVLTATAGIVAFDGEREVELLDGDQLEIVLDRQGPWTVDIGRAMQEISRMGILRNTDALQSGR